MAPCSRSSLRFVQPKSNNVPSNPFGGERRKRIRAINQEMNQNGDNGCNFRCSTFVSHFDFKPNRVNDNERVFFFEFNVHLKINRGCCESNQAPYRNKFKTHPWTTKIRLTCALTKQLNKILSHQISFCFRKSIFAVDLHLRFEAAEISLVVKIEGEHTLE